MLCIVAYTLCIFPQVGGNRTKNGSIGDPEEILEAEWSLFALVQVEQLSA